MAIQCVAADSHLRSSQTMGLSATSPMTVTTWMNCTWNPGARRSFVGIYGPATDVALGTPVTALQIGTTAGGGELSVWTWGGTVLATTAAAFMTPYNGTWVFVACSYNGTTFRLYLNGVEVATGTTAQQAGFLNQVFINGYPTSTTGEVADHQVDAYALYRRTLSANEILTIYNARGNRHGINDSIVCKYEFDELSTGSNVTSVADLTGNGHTLTHTGAGANATYIYLGTTANTNIRPVQ